MDRDNRWERIQLAYDMLTAGTATYSASDAMSALEFAYHRNETDEFVQPTIINSPHQAFAKIKDDDAVIFMNFRADRARQLTRAMTDATFTGFDRTQRPKLNSFVTLTEYASDIQAQVAFKPERINNTLGEVISQQGLKQLRIAETEKYAHVTFFFNGGIEAPFDGEQRILVPSPKVATYDLQPEMSAADVTSKLIETLAAKQTALIICNFANPDMVGHTGNLEATIKAIETVDTCLGKICQALANVNGQAIITADHGNAECLFDENTGQALTSHTTLQVPCVLVGRDASVSVDHGVLSDIAPSLLALMNIEQPADMTGKPIFAPTD